MRICFPLAGVTLALLAGCAGIPPDLGRGDVAGLLETRGITPPIAARPLVPSADAALDAAGAIQLALANDPVLRAAFAQLGYAAADLYDASRLSNPTLTASALIPDYSGAATQVGVGIVQNIAELVLLPARTRIAAGEFERLKASIGQVIVDRIAATERAYYALVGAEQTARLRAEVARAANAAAELAVRFFDAGNLNRLELALEQAAAAEARLRQLEAAREVVRARAALGQAMGLGALADAWRVQSYLPEPPAEADPLPSLFAAADRARLDLDAARNRVAILADLLGVTRRYRYLGLVAVGLETEKESDRSRMTGPTVAIELPLFNQGGGRVARAQAALAEAEAELAALEVAIVNSVRRAHGEAANAHARARTYLDTLIPLRETIVARSQEQVNYMLLGQFELIRAKQQEYEAYANALDATRDYWMARVDLAREIGAALPATRGMATLPIDPMNAPESANLGHIHPAGAPNANTHDSQPVSPAHGIHGIHAPDAEGYDAIAIPSRNETQGVQP